MDTKLLKITAIVIAAALVVGLPLAAGCGKGQPTSVVLATTTSVQDSGLLDYMLPEFEKGFNHKVKVIAVGSGEAIAMGKRGDADVLLVHSKDEELKFVKEGYGLQRVEIMYNDFVIVGPGSDPAGIKGGASAVDAFKKIASSGSTFISRGDRSGTNVRELKLWATAGVDPTGRTWYVQTGQGMGETLTITDQKRGYTLSDRATYVARKNGVRPVVLVEGDRSLLNPYSVIVVKAQKHPGIKFNVTGAADFCGFMTAKKGQQMIGSYKKGGTVLFHPDAKTQTRGMDGYKE